MKRFLSLMLAALMTLSLGAFASADEDFVALDCSGSTPDYNPDDTVNVVLEFTDITLASGDGISHVEFSIAYPDTVTPDFSPAQDGDGDSGNFISLLTEAPSGWLSLGRHFAAQSYYNIGFFDESGSNFAEAGSSITVTIPFKVKSDTKVEDIVFELSEIYAYNGALSDFVKIDDCSVVIEYALQPSSSVTLPSNALPLENAGYEHAAKNVIYYAESEITVGDYIRSYMEITNNQQDMNYFAILIADSNNVITYVDTVIGRPASDKSAVVIPAGSYIIGVNGNKTSDFATFKSIAALGATVQLYNVNVEAANPDSFTPLVNAGFTVSPLEPVLKEDAPAIYNSDSGVLILYTSNIELEDFLDLFENDVTILDSEGAEVTEGIINSDMTLDFGDGIEIAIKGDVNKSGAIDYIDYMLLKRAVMKTYTLVGIQTENANINTDSDITYVDYMLLKRVVMKTYTITVPNN